MKKEIVNTYFHPKYPFEIVVVDVNLDGKILKKQILLDEILDKCVSFPMMQLPDKKILAKAREIALEKI